MLLPLQKRRVNALTNCPTSSVPAQERYRGIKYNRGTESKLRISNGSAGQSGLVGALSQAYIDWSREYGGATEDYVIDWIVSDTTDSLQSGDADIAITYNAAAEYRAMNLSIATRRVYGFRDHFYIVGPKPNPANLSGTEDSAHAMFNKIVRGPHPLDSFLAMINLPQIKESLLFTEIGQIPWGIRILQMGHQYPQFPIAALTAAAELDEYTLTDRGTFLTLQSQNTAVGGKLEVFKEGTDTDLTDPLLNPAAILLGGKICSAHAALANGFIDWMK